MTLLETVKDLRNNRGWNVLPLGDFVRNPDGKKEVEFLVEYTKYRDKYYPIELFEQEDKAQHILIMTGKLSNLTIIDLDSSEAVETLEELTGEPIYNLCNYIIKTQKGFQLFYKYNPKIKSVTKYKGFGIDILNDNYQTFAHPANPGYTLIKDDDLSEIPEVLLSFFSGLKIINKTSDHLYKKKESYYANPFAYTIEEFINATRVSKKLIEKLESKFCTFQFEGLKLEDFGKGNRSSFLASVAAKLSLDPTIDAITFEAFMIKLNKLFTKMPEIELHKRFISRYTSQQATIIDKETGEYIPFWSFNKNWESEHENFDAKTILPSPDWSVWRDLEEGKYSLYHVPSDTVTLSVKQMLVDQLKHMFPEQYESGVATHLFPAVKTVFDPIKPHPFFQDEHGFEHYNTFKRTELMQYFIECTDTSDEIPEFINSVLNNVFPEKELKAKFLHDLAHHLRHLRHGDNAMITIGKVGGEGKGIIFKDLLELIYGKYYFKTSSKTFTGDFNGELKNKLFVYLDESDGKFNDSLLEGLKTVIANDIFPLIEKKQTPVNIKNHILLAISSNKSIPVQIDSSKDRRFNVSVALKNNLEDFGWFIKVKESEGVVKRLEKEVKPFLAYLAGLETDEVTYSKVINNEAKDALKAESKSTLDYTLELISKQDFDELEFILDEIEIEMLRDFGKIKVRSLIEAFNRIKVNANRKIKVHASEFPNLEVKPSKIGNITSQYLVITDFEEKM